MRTLEEIDQLQQSGFGRPQPRHGLQLLYWFARDGLTVDQNNALQLRCSPGNGDYGFHHFENRYERHGGKLLPDGPSRYYVIGNLSKSGSYNLPSYVKKHYTGCLDNSNKDRVLVSVYDTWFQAVYVTEHSDRSNFNKRATYQISRHLIMLIRGLSLDMFLWRTGYSTQQPNVFFTIPGIDPTYPNNLPAQYLASSTRSISTPAIRSSGNQIQIPISPDNQPASTRKSTTTSSGNRGRDLESGRVSQMNSHVIDDEAHCSILGAVRRCLCTIL